MTVGSGAGPVQLPPTAPDVLDPAVVASLRRLGERSGRDIFGELTSLFVSTAETQLAAAELSMQAGNTDEVARIAHALKGSSSVIGGRRVAAAAAALEDALLSGDAAAGERAALVRVGEELDQLRAELSAG